MHRIFLLYNIPHIFSTFREKFVYSVQKSKDRLGIARRPLGLVYYSRASASRLASVRPGVV